MMKLFISSDKRRSRCHWCPDGVAITRVNSKAGNIRLCWNCTMKRMELTSSQLEAQHRPFEDYTR